ncbi:Type I protein arginine methyltransferase [Ascochyta rabiei]|uniref:Protein transporter n=1 Tax=Didymella rabiei TaxID=5454 RepID=A0A163ICL4_DIDRA|nr:Type I protein arginine methyltransferase [Ascochyta rabiei]KZM25703.1 protein transporter [Ascochyta rabiei]UPX15606.1 Type I protein arginine methyltransferase [Ascochyta rabiei]
MMRVLEANAPPKQTATDTISTLSSRLQSATLLEDRRAAILGLRSFAKEYPASVASGALRGLIASLTKDADDVDTLKVVLETLLALFHPNDNSPEASDEIAMWLADEFTMRQDNMTILLDLLETPDLYSRLYPLQLIRACAEARPERTQECIQTAPMGTSRLATMLDDPRDIIRNEGLGVLSDLTRSSPELQKIFVFEDVFGKVFNMIHGDGGLTQGGIVVQDCLSLLANLIRFNTSNQTYFTKMEYPGQFVRLLPAGKKAKKTRGAPEEEDDWVSPQSDKNVWGLLIIMRMFLVKGSAATPQNQTAFVQYGLVRQLLNIAFDPATTMLIKVEALSTCADLIRGNPRMQEGFAQEQVRPFIQPATNGAATPNGVANVYVIEALLNLVLTPASNELFDMRSAGADCIKAYFHNHPQIREHFLNRAIGGHEAGDETQNALTILLEGSQASPGDPYRLWFAATLIFDLIFDNLQAKHTLMQVKEGDAENGEEVVTCIQTLTANLIASLQLEEDERISIAYLMLLLGWLFEDAAAVDDFLGEASSLQSLVQAVLRPGSNHTINRGLSAALLGTIYEFSTRDSPVPRRDLQNTLTGKLGREKYLNAITELRNHPLIRDFEVLPQRGGAEGGLPDVFFVDTCVDFLKDNFSRLTRAIDRNPNIEQHRSHDGVDRDIVDSLRGEIDGKEHSIQELKAQLMALEQKLDQEHADHRKTQQAADEQRNTLKRINDKLHNDLDTEIKNKDREHNKITLELENKYNLQVAALNNKLQQAAKESTLAVSRTKQEYDEKLHETIRSRIEVEQRLELAEKTRSDAFEKIRSLEQAHQQARNELSSINEVLRKAQAQAQQHNAQIQHLTEENESLQSTIDKLESEHHTALEKLKSEHQAYILELEAANEAANQSALDKLKSTQQSTTDKLASSHKAELEKLRADHKSANEKVSKQTTDHKAAVDKLTSEVTDLKTKLQDQTWKATEAQQKLAKAEAATKEAQEKLKKAEVAARESSKEESKTDTKAADVSKKLIKDLQDKLKKSEEAEKEKQTELDDLLVILGDLEEKRSTDKKRLKELGEEVSDAEDDDDEEDNEEDE